MIWLKIVERFFGDACVLELSGREDERGSMRVMFSQEEISCLPIDFHVVEQRIYSMPARGTFFGIHFQHISHPQDKMVSVIQGEGMDYVVDLRPDSATFRRWKAVPLKGSAPRAVFIPAGFGHAFLSIKDNTIQLFAVNASFAEGCTGRIHYLDKEIGLQLPVSNPILSAADGAAPTLAQAFNPETKAPSAGL